MGKVLLAETTPLEIELVGEALDEEQAEDKFLELRGIHFAAQDVGGFEKEAFELGESDFFAGHSVQNSQVRNAGSTDGNRLCRSFGNRRRTGKGIQKSRAGAPSGRGKQAISENALMYHVGIANLILCVWRLN